MKKRINILYEQMENVNTSYLEVQDTHEAAAHASKKGFVGKEILSEI